MDVAARTRIAVLSLAALAGGNTAVADDDLARSLALQEKLASTTRLDCSFSDKASGRWSDGRARPVLGPAQLEISFSNVNIEEGTAVTPGAYGSSYIVVKYSWLYLNLIQQLRDGPMYTTTVFATEASPGRFAAVHVRPEYTSAKLAGVTSEPAMYFGSCAAEAAGKAAPAPAPQAPAR
jgi:hypothetical protein